MHMKNISTPTTPEELEAVAKELDAAHYLANASDDPVQVCIAYERIIECGRAIDACPFTFDDDGKAVPNVPVEGPS
jgi:ferredoxin